MNNTISSVPKSVIECRTIVGSDGHADVQDIEGTRILWFSRHDLTDEQRADLYRIYGEGGNNLIQIEQHSATIQRPLEIPNLMDYDVWAIVAPIGLQQQFKQLAGDRPVIICEFERILLPDGGKVEFKFAGWFEIEKIEVIKRRL